MNSLLSGNKFLGLTEKAKHKLAANLIKSAYSDPSQFAAYQKVESWLSLPPILCTPEALSDRYHFHLHLATILLKEESFLPQITHLDSLSNEPFLPIDIYLDNLRSAHNVGSIMRTTEAFRLGEIHTSEKTPSSSHAKVSKSSMGTHSLIACHQNTPLTSLKRPLIALETHKDALSIYNFTFPKAFTLLVGNEEYGLSKQAIDAADTFLKIPLFGSKNSLNVANAFAIAAAEIRKQHQTI